MKVMITTALFDIKRDIKGDGRTIKEYLTWFEQTLKIKCDMTIFTEKKFEEFILKHRAPIKNKTQIVIQNLQELPFYKNYKKISEITKSPRYLRKIRHPRRVECVLPEYNLIQYSKFGWLKKTAENNKNHDYFFWMDVGCSRFFLDTDLTKQWPDTKLLNKDKFLIQRNTNWLKMWDNLDITRYIWDSNAMMCGGLFGGGREIVYKMEELIEKICQNIFFPNHCFNNEQFAIVIACKKYPDWFEVREQKLNNEEEGTFCIPMFKNLSIKGEKNEK
tara:strand:+ start:3719 stop:4543 length:825 start_codon:yes stop_codon:yes gene_type:complete